MNIKRNSVTAYICVCANYRKIDTGFSKIEKDWYLKIHPNNKMYVKTKMLNQSFHEMLSQFVKWYIFFPYVLEPNLK